MFAKKTQQKPENKTKQTTKQKYKDKNRKHTPWEGLVPAAALFVP